MTLREALIRYLTEKEIRGPETPAERLYADDWFRFYVGHRSIKVIKLTSMMDSVAIHDTHHLLTGYGTDVRGEAEITAWELASGGCGRHWAMWLDRLVAVPTLVVFYPRAAWAAAKRGWRESNLYGADFERVLGEDLDAVRDRVSARSR
jgi:hypothetical protein